MIKISAVIITYNEEKNIGRCLDSLMTIADDIVVVDSFSTDKTEEICREKGIRFVQNKFLGHIEQKNFAITQALHHYVLSLDADEELTPELAESISQVKKNWAADGYFVNRLTNYCGSWIRHGGWYPDKKLRLWDSRKGKWAGMNPHDRYELRPNSSTRKLKGDLLHYSFYSISQHVDQINYFTDISSETLFRKGKKAGIFMILFSPVYKFFRDFFLRGGFLDGYYGFIICSLSSYAKFLKYSKLRGKWKK